MKKITFELHTLKHFLP